MNDLIQDGMLLRHRRAGCFERGLVSIGTVTRLDVGYSARSASELCKIVTTIPVTALLVEYFTPTIEERTILHVDKDFDLIAEATGQPIERLKL